MTSTSANSNSSNTNLCNVDNFMADFLHAAKQSLIDQQQQQSFAISSHTRPHFVIGNPAGDADSIISALALAYVDSIIDSKRKNDSRDDNGPLTPCIPIVSIPLEDLKTQRPETTFLLHQCARIPNDYEDLISIDQTEILPMEATVTLVDHNHLSYYDTYLDKQQWTVTDIVDHHLDEHYHVESCPLESPRRNIAFDSTLQQALVASTCTLVVERFIKKQQTHPPSLVAPTTLPPSVSILLLGVIVLDSINMLPQAGKGTLRDGAAIQYLLDTTDWSRISLPAEIRSSDTKNDQFQPDTTKLFECLQSQKFSPLFWSHLTVQQAIRLDYKSFPIGPGQNDFLGISTILQDIDTFWNNKKESVESTLANVLVDNHLQVLGLMFTFMEQQQKEVEESKTPRRQLALASWNKDELRQLIEYLIEGEGAAQIDLQLFSIADTLLQEAVIDHSDDYSTTPNSQTTSILYFAQFEQRNVMASRKQIAPVLVGFWRKTNIIDADKNVRSES